MTHFFAKHERGAEIVELAQHDRRDKVAHAFECMIYNAAEAQGIRDTKTAWAAMGEARRAYLDGVDEVEIVLGYHKLVFRNDEQV